jgi:hypothetical protein
MALTSGSVRAPTSAPVIDPRSLTRAQRNGRRCAVRNCRSHLACDAVTIGHTPSGAPVLVCAHHPELLEVVE